MTSGAHSHVGGRGSAAGSLLGRVFTYMSLTMFAAVALVLAVLYVEFASHIDTLRDRSLSGQAADVARHLVREAGGGVRIDLPPALDAAYQDSAEYRYAVLGSEGRLLAGSPGVTGALDPDASLVMDEPRYFTRLDAVTGNNFLGASARHTDSTGSYVVQVQQSAEHQDVMMDTFLDELGDEVLWIVLVVFAAILLVTYWTLRASLASLTEISREAATVGPDSLDQRLSLERVPGEVVPIVNAVNDALDRVEEAFKQQRRFTADAAHEMRTPIAVLRAHLDTLGAGKARELERDLSALDRVLAQLLKLAQADALSLEPDCQADLHDVAVNVATLMGPTAVNAGRGIAVTGDRSVSVHGDEDALEVAVRNLVENAIKHTPEGSEVEIHVDAAARELRVMDRGCGVLEEDREKVFQRFWRRNRSDTSGAGLGLSIAARVAAAHGAIISVDGRDGGGAVFAVTFPMPAGS